MEIETIVFECPRCGEKFHAVPLDWKETDKKVKNGEPLFCDCPRCGTHIKSTPAINDELTR